MSFPIHDWQFWVSTLVALAAAFWIARSMGLHALRTLFRKDNAPTKKVSLTVEGRRPRT